MLWFWGACGAFVFAAPTLSFALWAESHAAETDHRLVIRAVANFVIALMTGMIFAQGLTAPVQALVSRIFAVNATSVALTIGWASNYLWPKVLRKLGERVEKSDPGKGLLP